MTDESETAVPSLFLLIRHALSSIRAESIVCKVKRMKYKLGNLEPVSSLDTLYLRSGKESECVKRRDWEEYSKAPFSPCVCVSQVSYTLILSTSFTGLTWHEPLEFSNPTPSTSNSVTHSLWNAIGLPEKVLMKFRPWINKQFSVIAFDLCIKFAICQLKCFIGEEIRWKIRRSPLVLLPAFSGTLQCESIFFLEKKSYHSRFTLPF